MTCDDAGIRAVPGAIAADVRSSVATRCIALPAATAFVAGAAVFVAGAAVFVAGATVFVAGATAFVAGAAAAGFTCVVDPDDAVARSDSR
ncbi:hypothetical protein Aph02nite_81550 [Actinoplanes philippinensis]|nr:hypothetical protein Aph02nite_81550 [Actinoplanes philippinensis]